MGRIKGSHGLNGLMKVNVYLENSDILEIHEVFYLGQKYLKSKIVFKNVLMGTTWLAALQPAKPKEYINKLKGTLIFIEDKFLPALSKDEYYYADLEGLKIKIRGSNETGFVKRVCNFGSGDILEVSMNSILSTVYIPFDKENVKKIDHKEKTITLSPQKGLLDLKL